MSLEGCESRTAAPSTFTPHQSGEPGTLSPPTLSLPGAFFTLYVDARLLISPRRRVDLHHRLIVGCSEHKFTSELHTFMTNSDLFCQNCADRLD